MKELCINQHGVFIDDTPQACNMNDILQENDPADLFIDPLGIINPKYWDMMAERIANYKVGIKNAKAQALAEQENRDTAFKNKEQYLKDNPAIADRAVAEVIADLEEIYVGKLIWDGTRLVQHIAGGESADEWRQEKDTNIFLMFGDEFLPLVFAKLGL